MDRPAVNVKEYDLPVRSRVTCATSWCFHSMVEKGVWRVASHAARGYHADMPGCGDGINRKMGITTVMKRAIVVAGPNGASKTTFAGEYLKAYDNMYLSADAIAERMCPGDPASVRFAAGRVFFEELKAGVAGDRDLLFESTLSGRTFGRVTRRLCDADYAVTIVFIFLETADACVARVKQRVQAGGHDVPEEDIVRRFGRSLWNFWHLYRNRVDNWILFCNSSDRFQVVALGQGEEHSVIDEELFEIFLTTTRIQS